jgi:hypothetical protein
MRTFAIFATICIVTLLFLQLRKVVLPGGGGQYEESPNGVYTAYANSLHSSNPLAADRRTYYEFTIRYASGKVLKQATLYPSEQNDPMYFRSLPTIIAWSPNSSDVIFTIPGVTLQLDTAEHSDRNLQ